MTSEPNKSHSVLHIGTLAQELGSGAYRPEPARRFQVTKADGSPREVSAFTLRDKLAQRAILTVLTPLGEALFLDNSYGFRPGCTQDMAYSRVRELIRQGLDWLVLADLRDCFDHIPHRPVLQALGRLCGDRELVRLVECWMTGQTKRRFFFPWQGHGLPQGMVLSPFLSNLHLHNFDLALRRQEIALVRYADNFVLFGRSSSQAERALAKATKILYRLGMEINGEKTKIVQTSPKHQFLGQRLPPSPILASTHR